MNFLFLEEITTIIYIVIGFLSITAALIFILAASVERPSRLTLWSCRLTYQASRWAMQKGIQYDENWTHLFFLCAVALKHPPIGRTTCELTTLKLAPMLRTDFSPRHHRQLDEPSRGVKQPKKTPQQFYRGSKLFLWIVCPSEITTHTKHYV